MTGWTWYSLLSRNSQTRNLATQNLAPAVPYPNKKSGRLSPIAFYYAVDSQTRNLATRNLAPAVPLLRFVFLDY